MSEPWAVNAGKASTALGTATIASATNLLTIAGHGLGDGDTVTVDTLTGGGSALTADAVYFVRDATTDDFALSLTLHGPQVEFASDGGADVYHFSPQYTASQLRRLNAGLMFGGTSDAFGVRQGVRPGHVPLSVSGTTWTVEDLTGAVYPGLSSDDGGYPVAHQSESGSLTPADGSNDRIDALDLQIQDDDEDASGFRRARVVYDDTATPGSGSPPPLTSNALRLGTILVPSGGSPSPSVDTLAQWTVASGGVLPVRDDTEGPSAGMYVGMVRYRQDTDVLEAWDGSAWSQLARLGGWSRIAAGSESGVGAFDIDLTAGGSFPAGTFGTIRVRADGFVDGASGIGLRVNGQTGNTYIREVLTFDIAAGGTIDEAQHNTGGSAWLLGEWGTGQYNPLEFTIFRASDSVEISMQYQSSNLGSGKASIGGGRYNGNILPSTLTLFIANGGTEFSQISWEVEGYIK